MVVLLVDVGFGDLHSTKDPAMDLYIIQMSKLILQSAIKYNGENSAFWSEIKTKRKEVGFE